jgi:hypothetical protein
MDHLANTTRDEARAQDGRRVVSYNGGIKALAVLSSVLAGGTPFIMLDGGVGIPIVAYGISGGLSLVAGGLIYGALLTRLEFDEYNIYFSSPLYRDRQISWVSVIGGGYSTPLKSYWIMTEDIGRIWVSPMQHGWVEILQFAGAKLEEQNVENPFQNVEPTDSEPL